MAKLSILKRPQVDMINGPLLKNMIKFAIPFFISNVLQSFFNAADLAVVGSFCGSDKVAAVGATGTLARLSSVPPVTVGHPSSTCLWQA